MTVRSKEAIRTMLVKDITDICERHDTVLKSIQDGFEDTLDYMQTLIAQIPQSMSGPLISKTPKVLRKKAVQRIETIPEDDVVNVDFSTVEKQSNADDTEAEVTLPSRSKREASKKAADNIRRQESLSLRAKLRRPSDEDNETFPTKKNRDTRSKRTLSSRSSDEDDYRPPKHYKGEATKAKDTSRNTSKLSVVNGAFTDESPGEEDRTSSQDVRRSNRKRTIPHGEEPDSKKAHVVDETLSTATTDDLDEPSMYEDAIGKPVPVMNSTMNCNSTMVLDKSKMMNLTVVLEPLSGKKNFNETVTITKKSSSHMSLNAENENDVTLSNPTSRTSSCRSSKNALPSKTDLQDGMQKVKESFSTKNVDELLTDDESSPERKKPVRNLKKREKQTLKKNVARIISSDEDEVSSTPQKPVYKTVGTTLQEMKNSYKPNALFSPYAKDSVKKRVEAFEQAGMNSPKAVDVDAPTRVTRTKTRAMAAAEVSIVNIENVNGASKSIAQKLARKSLAKAKKISLARVKDFEENKENDEEIVQRNNKNATHEKFGLRQPQRVTPVEKSRIRVPMSASRIPQTPSNIAIPINYTKAASATRGNIVTTMDSFIHPSKTIKKTNSSDKLDEKKRKLNDEDARRKREEALRLQTEEKRRKREEKELKNKLAREAKERQEMERRIKAEREREEKARLAQQQQEKQREEQERKRLAQLQRAQEKEERRRKEEQIRMQRLQEQEEAERLLAEQRRREQEAERRKEAEARAQHQASVEAMRLKHQMLMAHKQQQLQSKKLHDPSNYILDSEPDEDESDDESRPKYAIPYWAQPDMRKPQLAMQRFIPQSTIFRFFDTRRCTPDLTKLFQGIDKNRLKRTSSAIWKTPPRFSMMEAD